MKAQMVPEGLEELVGGQGLVSGGNGCKGGGRTQFRGGRGHPESVTPLGWFSLGLHLNTQLS